MSATEDDTELRDLLIQNLENNGVLNKLKAEMRAAVFLAMEEQDKLENKSPLVNENLKKCLNTRDGRLVAGLIVDFLQVFNLDFSLAVFQPETNSASLNSVDSREVVCRDLGLSESEVNRKCPLLLELVTRGRHKASEEPSQKRITLAQKTFDLYDKDGSGSVGREDVKNVFTDLFPGLNKTMLEHFITDELRAADQSFPCTVDFQMFVGFYKRLFSQCRAVVFQDSSGGSPEQKVHSPVSKHLDSKASLGKVDVQLPRSRPGGASLGPERRRAEIRSLTTRCPNHRRPTAGRGRVYVQGEDVFTYRERTCLRTARGRVYVQGEDVFTYRERTCLRTARGRVYVQGED
uniref:Centrosomal protein 43 n=1 Tax=Gasterosteus aculeatus aculeatus TaxID=481459 RepID=G3PKV5_GASAC